MPRDERFKLGDLVKGLDADGKLAVGRIGHICNCEKCASGERSQLYYCPDAYFLETQIWRDAAIEDQNTEAVSKEEQILLALSGADVLNL